MQHRRPAPGPAPDLESHVRNGELVKEDAVRMSGSDVVVHQLREMGTSPTFQASDAACVIVDRKLIIRAVNPAYQSATMRWKDELQDRYLFDAFPNNPHDPAADGVTKLGASLERVLRSRRRDRMRPQRYDIPHPRDHDQFVKKVWLPVNSPIVEGDRVIGIMHHVEDTDLIAYRNRLEVVLAQSQRAEVGDFAQALTDTQDALRAAHHQVEMLQTALETNRDIGTAIGILMYRHKLDREAAWNLLRAMSQQNNRKVRDLALRVIEIGTLP
jgi:ANTAR domain